MTTGVNSVKNIFEIKGSFFQDIYFFGNLETIFVQSRLVYYYPISST